MGIEKSNQEWPEWLKEIDRQNLVPDTMLMSEETWEWIVEWVQELSLSEPISNLPAHTD